jgi:hypothetical protein
VDYGVGRLYAVSHKNTYQSMFNITRRLVIDGNLTSIDLVNAQPTFLVQLCVKHGDEGYIPKYLKHYVNERDKVGSNIMSKCNISKDEVKHLFIVMMFGGSHKKWFIEKNLPVPDCKFLKELDEELTVISTGIAPNYFPEYKKFQAIARNKRKTMRQLKSEQLLLYTYKTLKDKPRSI